MISVRTPSAIRRRRAASLMASLEMLESRTLLSAVTGYTVDAFSQPRASVVDPNGNLWVADAQQVEEIQKNSDGTLTTSVYETDHIATQLAYDPVDNDIFAAEYDSGGGYIQKLDLSGDILATYTISTTDLTNAPQSLTVASDGSIWFTTMGQFGAAPTSTYTSNIGHMDLSGNFTFQAIPVTNTYAVAISAASDGSVWFGCAGVDQQSGPSGNSAIGQASLNGDGSINITMYDIPNPVDQIGGLVVAPDNSIWYSVDGDLAIPNSRPATTESINHAVLADGALSVTSYTLPTAASEGYVDPATLAFDSSGTLWFTDNNAIDNLDPTTGDITRINPDNSGAFVGGLAVGPSDVWVSYAGGPNYNLGDIDLNTYTPPIIATPPDISASVGQAFSGPVAVFASADAGNFSYTIDYGNGTTQSGTLANDPSGVYTINGTTTYATGGTYATQVVITADAGDTVSVNGQATVSSSIPLVSQGVDLTAEKGQAIAPNVSGVANVVVAQFSGAPASYTATINWGDSTSTVGQVVSLGNNQYYVEIPTGTSKSYAAAGSYNISVLITDGTNSTTATSTATITAIPITASQNLVLQPLLGGIVLTTVATFTADPSTTAFAFKATINWGDGSTSVGLVVRTSAGNYVVIGLHLYTHKGTYTVDTSILDNSASESALATATIKIA